MRKVQEHQDQIKSDIPKLCRMMPAQLQGRIQLDLLVAALSRSPFVIHGMPFITGTRR